MSAHLKPFPPLKITLVRCPIVISTYDLAKELMDSGNFGQGLLVMADYQEKGRGQMGAEWEGEPGKNLLLSLALEPQMALENQFLLNMSIALVLTEFLEKHLGQTQIKWPNDILHQGKKVAGILIENSIQGNTWAQSIVGMGINVNQTQFNASKKASSMMLIASKTFNLDELLSELISLFETKISTLMNEPENTKSAYHQKLMFYKKWTRFRSKDIEFEARVEGVDAFGRLMLDTGSEIKTFGIKELDWLEL